MTTPFTISVVCLGNICRSPMGEVMLRSALEQAGLGEVVVESAGTGDWHIGGGADRRAVDVIAASGLDLSAHVARQFDAGDFERVDLVIAMDSSHVQTLAALTPDADSRAKVRLLRSFDPEAGDDLDVADPYFGDRAGFDITYDDISAALPGVVEFVRAAVSARA